MVRTETRTLLLLDSPILQELHDLPGYEARVVPDWDALEDAMTEAPPSTVALVDPYAGWRGGGPSPRVREVIVRHPSIPVVPVLKVRSERVKHVQKLLDWGVSEFLDLDLETHAALVRRLRGAHARPLKERVEAILSRYASEYARRLLWAACDVAVDCGTAPDLARRFGVGSRTMAAWCAREGLPSPRRLLAWLRVLLAATLLEEPDRSVLNAARAAGYATDHALRRAMRELIGGDPATLPRERLFTAAAERFGDELFALRERARERLRARLQKKKKKANADAEDEHEVEDEEP
jgi:AraC-like DNA-binding protein